MNKLFSKIAALSVGLAMAIGVGVAVSHESVKEVRAEDQAITLTEATGGTFGAVTVAIAQAGGSSTPISGSYGVRLYAKNTLTVSVSGYLITGITFNWTKNSRKDFATVTASEGSYSHPSAAGTGTWSGSTDTVVFTVGASGQIQVKTMSVTYQTASGPSVAIDNLPESLSVGDTGKLTATASGATSPVIEWSSSDPTVVSIDKDTGDYEALKCGAVTFTASMTCTEGSASKTSLKVPVNGVDVLSVAEALALDPGTGQTTDYSIVVAAYITSLDPDTKTRAFTLSDSKVGVEGGNAMTAYGIFSTNQLRSYAILNGMVTFRGKIQNYKGSVQLSSLTLVSYSDAAMTYAKTAYESLNEACATGPAAVTDEQWNGLAGDFGALDEYARAKLAAAGSDYQYSDDIANWIGRYGRIVAAGRTNFMENTNVSSQYFGNFESNNNSYIIIIVIASVSVLSFGLALALRKKRTK